MRAAELEGYDVLLTLDQGIPHQQHIAITIRSATSQIEDLLPLVDAILETLPSLTPGQIVAIPAAKESNYPSPTRPSP